MHKWFRILIGVAFCGLFLLRGQTMAQEEDPTDLLYTLVNQARMDEGLPPFDRPDSLVSSAQRHADDMAANTLSTSTGSDGSDAAQRIAQAGYFAWGNGETVGERFWIGTGSAQDAFDWFMDDPLSQEHILSGEFRELGIGAATAASGQLYYVLDLGARPNVLPIFVNEDAETTESPQIAIRLTNEEARPQGEGTAFMGRAIEVRISNTPNFEDSPWQQWAPQVEWTLPGEPGEHTVYIQFRDGGGRTAASTDSIFLLPGEGTPLPPTPTPLSLPPTSTPLPPPVSPPEGQATVTIVVQPTNTPALVATPRAELFPTWTPLATPMPDSKAGESDPWVALLCGLQVIAILLGISLALRRGRR